MQETRVQSLGWEDPLEKEMATHFSILAWKAHGQRSLVGYSSRGLKESDTTKYLTLSYPLNSANVVIIHMNKTRLKVIPMTILTQNLKSCQGRGIPFHPQSYEHVKESAFSAETQVRSLGQGRSPREGKGSLSSTLAWRSPWIEEPGELQSMGLQRVDTTEWLTLIHSVISSSSFAPAEESAKPRFTQDDWVRHSNAQSLLLISQVPWPGVHFFSWQDLACPFPGVMKREACKSWQMAGKSGESLSVHFYMIEFRRKKNQIKTFIQLVKYMGRNEPFLDFSDFRDPFGIQFINFANVKSTNSDPCARVNDISTGEFGRIVKFIKDIFETLHNYAKYI